MDAVLLILLGGVAALDGTGWGQFMWSRPLAAAALGGWIAGDPGSGLLVGGLLELAHLGVLPVGGARFPETGPASLVAGAAAAVPAAQGHPGALPFAVLLGLVLAQVGGGSIIALRRFNTARAPHPEAGEVTEAQVQGTHLRLMGVDFLRGALLVALGLALTGALAGTLVPRWPLPLDQTLALLLLGSAIPMGVLLRRAGTRGAARGMFFAGLAGGLVLAALLGGGAP